LIWIFLETIQLTGDTDSKRLRAVMPAPTTEFEGFSFAGA
jgi:hypothetical protein